MTVNSTIPSQFVLILIPIILIPLVLMPSTLSMIHVWTVNETFTHGFLILPISLWMLWQNIDNYRLMPIRPEPAVLLLIIPISMAWFVASVVDVQVVQHFALVFLIQTSVWLMLGRHAFMQLLSPLAYLIFMVPFGQGLIPVMMEFTANFTVTLIQFSGIPVYQDGLYFHLPSGNWSVVEECSGVRYLIASMALGTLFAYINYHSLKKRLIFILFAILVPILANGLRAYGIVMIGHLSDMQLATGVDHLVYGWVFFGIIIFLMFMVGMIWADRKPALHSEMEIKLEAQAPIKKPLVLMSITLALTAGLLIYAQSLTSEHPSNDRNRQIELHMPAQFGPWQHEANEDFDWQPVIKNPTLSISHLYRSDNNQVQLDIGYFARQTNESEAVSTQNSVVPYGSDDWKKLRSVDLKLAEIAVSENEIQAPNQVKLLVWQWFQIGSYTTPSPYIAKVYDAFNQIVLQRNDAAYITMATPLSDDPGISRQILQEFWLHSSKDIHLQIDQASNQIQ
jgi:exosortase A